MGTSGMLTAADLADLVAASMLPPAPAPPTWAELVRREPGLGDLLAAAFWAQRGWGSCSVSASD